MWSWIIKVTVVSLLLIFLIHYLYTFLKTTLTAPKLKDLVNKPQAKYNTIYTSLQNTADSGGGGGGSGGGGGEASKNLSMKDELLKYVRELSVGTDSTSGGVSAVNGKTNNNNINMVKPSENMSSSNIIMPQNETTSIYSPTNILSDTGANGISTRVNNNNKYMRDINNISSHPTSATSTIDFGTPDMSSSYSSTYSPY
jgi:hypothetical protein